MEKKFKCKDEVIYRSSDDSNEWIFGLFSHYGKNKDGIEYVVINGGFYRLDDVEILPYEGNEELVGTMDEPETEVRLEEGELVFASDNPDCSIKRWCFDEFIGLYDGNFKTDGSGIFYYLIKFSDFNPNDMEETRKHILCVKGGKIIRYKG